MPPKRRASSKDDGKKSEKRQKTSEGNDSEPVLAADKPESVHIELPHQTPDETAQIQLVKSIIENAASDPNIKLNEIETILLYWFSPGGLCDCAVEQIEEYESYTDTDEPFDGAKYKHLMDRAMLRLAENLVE